MACSYCQLKNLSSNVTEFRRLCWSENNLFKWVDPKVRDNSDRDFLWLESVWKRVLYTSNNERIIAKLFSLSANLPAFQNKYKDAKILYLIRNPIDLIPSGLSLVTGVLDKQTMEAVAELQRKHGILNTNGKASGVLTPKTREALKAVSGS